MQLFRVVFAGHKPPIEVNLNPVQPGDVICSDDKFTLSAFPVSHRGPGNLGYLFEEKSRRPFLVEKAEALNVPPGPERAQLVRGEAVTLADGRVIQPDDVLGETLPGTKYVHIGDVGRTNGLADIVREADALVMESTYLEDEAEMAADFGHMTAAGAAGLALSAAGSYAAEEDARVSGGASNGETCFSPAAGPQETVTTEQASSSTGPIFPFSE